MRTAVSLLDRANSAKTKEDMHQLIFEAAGDIERLEGELESALSRERTLVRRYNPLPAKHR